jgi:hypothetical protein
MALAVKNMINRKRISLRFLKAAIKKPEFAKFETPMRLYKAKVVKDLIDNVNQIIDVIEGTVLKKCILEENKAFFIRIVADNCRYVV